MTHPAAWNDERDAVLREMAAAGKSASVIAASFACSRDAVIGRAHRLGVQLNARSSSGGKAGAAARARAKAKAKPGAPPVKPAQRPKGAQLNNRNLAAWSAQQKVAARIVPPPLPPAPQLAAPKSIATVGFRDCRYIGARPELVTVDTPVFCGRRAREGSSYCEEHHALCWTTRPGRRLGVPSAVGKLPM
jgi:hypothetical protein